jgi:hypothetical protein
MRNILLACALVTWIAPPMVAVSAEDEKAVRKLTVEVDPIAGSQWSANPGARAMGDQKEAAKLLGQSIAKQVVGKIDFAKEDLVHVAWGGSGPPFGTLQYEIKDGKDGKTITFYIKEPKAAIRGQAFRIGNDFFAVPKKSKVVFGPAR